MQQAGKEFEFQTVSWTESGKMPDLAQVLDDFEPIMACDPRQNSIAFAWL